MPDPKQQIIDDFTNKLLAQQGEQRATLLAFGDAMHGQGWKDAEYRHKVGPFAPDTPTPNPPDDGQDDPPPVVTIPDQPRPSYEDLLKAGRVRTDAPFLPSNQALEANWIYDARGNDHAMKIGNGVTLPNIYFIHAEATAVASEYGKTLKGVHWLGGGAMDCEDLTDHKTGGAWFDNAEGCTFEDLIFDNIGYHNGKGSMLTQGGYTNNAKRCTARRIFASRVGFGGWKFAADKVDGCTDCVGDTLIAVRCGAIAHLSASHGGLGESGYHKRCSLNNIVGEDLGRLSGGKWDAYAVLLRGADASCTVSNVFVGPCRAVETDPRRGIISNDHGAKVDEDTVHDLGWGRPDKPSLFRLSIDDVIQSARSKGWTDDLLPEVLR